MRLRDAIIHVDREFEMEAKQRFKDATFEAAAEAVISAEHQEIRASNILETFKAGTLIDPQTAAKMDPWLSMAIRFGMRVQRKLDHPEKETSMFDSPCVTRCSVCRQVLGTQHKPSCQRQGVVSTESDYRDRPQ